MFISISRYIFLLGYLSTVEIVRYPYVNDKYIYVLILTIQIDTETYIIICSVMKMVLIFYAVLWCNARLASILPVKQRLFYIPIMITTFFFGKLKQLLWKQTTKIRRTIKMHRSLMRNIFCWEVNWFYILHLPCVRLDTFSKINSTKKMENIIFVLSATGTSYKYSQF